MGISRASRHKRRATGGRMSVHQKKRKYEMGRPAANTKLGATRVRPVRVRGGNTKLRALRLDSGNYSWGSENISKPTRITAVLYNASNNELVRTNTLVKNTIVAVDAGPFKSWFEDKYRVTLGKKRDQKGDKEGKGAKDAKEADAEKETPAAPSPDATAAEGDADATKVKRRKYFKPRKLDPLFEEQFNSGRLLACISSRPGQVGRADGYILEGPELVFYKRKLEKKKKN